MRPPEDAGADFDAGTMAAVQGALTDIERELAALAEAEGLHVIVANQNSSSQAVIAGPTDEVRRAGRCCGQGPQGHALACPQPSTRRRSATPPSPHVRWRR